MANTIYEPEKIVEPLRESMIVLIYKLLLAMAGIDAVYIFFRVAFFDLNSNNKYISGNYADIGFFLFLIVSYILQIILVITIVQKWISTRYIFDEKTLIIRRGFFKTTERIYDLGDLRSVRVSQDIMGKLFQFGSVELTLSAPNLLDEVVLYSIPYPQAIEKSLKKLL